MIRLYMVRHGETVANVEGRIQGQSDAELTSLGVRQVEAIADRLASERFAAAYSSDLGRALATARAVAARHGLDVCETPLLRERRFGVIEGLTRPEIDRRFPSELHEWRRDPVLWYPPGAETREGVVERCGRFVAGLVGNCADGDQVLVVGHGGSVRGAIIAACGLPLAFSRMIALDNASLSILDVGDQPSLLLLNDTCHLDTLRGAAEDVENA